MIAVPVPSWSGSCALLACAVGLLTLGWLVRAALQEFGRGRVPCLLYHQLAPAEVRQDPGLTDPVYVCYADRFAEQMDHLARAGYTTLSLSEFMQSRLGVRPLPPRPVIVTFDDGFASVHTYAFPVLRGNRQKATLFMTPDRDSRNFADYAHRDRPLSDEEIREMAAFGIDIESHGLTHRYLTDLDGDELSHELEESRAKIERVTGRRVRFLAIPGGAYDRRVKRMARRAGYEAVFCMRKGSAGLRGDPFALPRMVVARDMALTDFRALLVPPGWLRGRIISTAQEWLSRTLGMSRTNLLRNWLYTSPLRALLRPRAMVWLILGGSAAVIALLAWLGRHGL